MTTRPRTTALEYYGTATLLGATAPVLYYDLYDAPLQHHSTTVLQPCCNTTAFTNSYRSTVVQTLQTLVQHCSYDSCARVLLYSVSAYASH
eukprot:3073987-Pyramimonas_sp.AAC.1